MRDRVNNLILEEMGRFQPPDYFEGTALGSALTAAATVSSDLIRAELEMLAKGESHPRIDVSRYESASAPTGAAAEDPAEWESAVRRAQVAAEALSLRSVNLELMSKYGVDAWKAHVSDMEKLSTAGRANADAAASACGVVNEQRRATVEPHAQRLHGLQRKWAQAVDSNFQIQLACSDAEREVRRLRALVAEQQGASGGSGSGSGGAAQQAAQHTQDSGSMDV